MNGNNTIRSSAPMKYSKKIEKQALFWYVRIQSTDFSSQQEAVFHHWLESSSAHQAAFLRIEQAWCAGGSYRHIANQGRINWGQWGWVSACAALVLGMAFYFGQPILKLNSQKEYYTTAAHELKTITLQDGTTLNMHSDTEVSINFEPDARYINLNRGGIFLAVAASSERPLFVVTSKGAVRVIGTQFEVDDLVGDFSVTVLEGKVGLLQLGTPIQSTAPFVVVEKNQRILYSHGIDGKTPEIIDASHETSWVKGRLIFTGTPLNEVIIAVNKYLPTPILIGSSGLEQKRIVGAISIKNSIAAANSLAQISGASVETAVDKSALILKLKSN